MNNSSPSNHAKIARKSRVGLFLSLLAFSFIFTDSSYAQATDTLKCGKTLQINLGNILTGDSVVETISIVNGLSGVNDTDSTWTISSSTPPFFTLSVPENKVPLWQVWKVPVICKLTDTLLESGQFNLNGYPDTSCNPVIILSANGIGPTKDSSTFSLQAATPEVIALRTNSDTTSGTYYFKNNSDSDIVIDSVSIKETSAFSIANPPVLPLHIPRQDSFPLTIDYQRTSQGSDNGYLVVGKPDDPILLEVALQGVRTANESVQTQPSTSSYVWLYPNPARGPVTIHTQGLSQAHVRVADMLGRTLDDEDFTGDWIWNGTNSDQESGTYFIAITGYSDSGLFVHEVKRLVLLR